jgi:hypothetical protein
MNRIYAIGRIKPHQIEQAYLLVQPVAESLDLATWRTFCHDALGRQLEPLGRQEDVIVATDPLGYVRGLCIVRLVKHPAYGRMLDVPIFVAASAVDDAGVSAELLRYLKTRGVIEGCRGIYIWTLGDDNWNKLSHDSHEHWDHGTLILFDSDGPVLQ